MQCTQNGIVSEPARHQLELEGVKRVQAGDNTLTRV
jgi:hypothetical protein